MRIVLALFLILFALPVNASELRITVEGIRSPHGTILIGLYDSVESFTRAIELSDKDGFLNDPNRFAAVALRANAAKKSAVVFTNLDPGQYAIILFHDENGNGKLDTNALGVPTEPYGFSNNVRGFLSPPTFKKAVIDLDPQATAAKWGDRREQTPPEVISAQAVRLPQLLTTAREGGADLTIIDTAPNSDSTALAAAKAADLIS